MASVLLVLLSSTALASMVWPTGERWLAQRWTASDGLPMEHINSLELGADGRIWLATFGGLLVFDGRNFESVGVGTPTGVHSPRVLQVVRQPGTEVLWLGFVDGRIERHGPDGVELFDAVGGGGPCMVSDGEQLWLSAGDHELFVLEDRPRKVAEFDFHLQGLELDEHGDLWTRTVEDGRRIPVDVGGGSTRVADGHPRWMGAGDWRSDHRTLFHGEEAVLEVDEGIQDLRFDGESVWLATGAGLVRVRERPLDVLLPPDGMGPSVAKLWWDNDRSTLWALSDQKMWWSVRNPSDRLSPEDVDEPPWPDAQPLPSAALPLAVGPGRPWWATQGVVQAVDPTTQRLEPVPGTPRFWLALSSWLDPQQRLWLGASPGLHLMEDGRWTELQAADGPVHSALSFVGLPDGSTVIGAQKGLVWADATVKRVVGPKAPFPVAVRHVRVDERSLWASTEERGLCVVSLGSVPDDLDAPQAWRCLGEASGLGTYGVHVSLPDAHGHTWVSANRGLGWMDTVELEAFARGDVDRVEVVWLGEREGMRSSEANGSLGGAAVATADGSLWFPTQEGVVRVFPERIREPVAPSVHVTSVAIDGVRGAGTNVRLEPGAAVQVQWTGASLTAPELVVFRHRLGTDAPWSVPSATTDLLLNRLEPGDHVLEVQAGVAGRWSPSATVSIHRVPTLAERPSTRVALAAFLAVVVGAAFRLRMRAAQRREAQLTVRVAEATDALRRVGQELEERNQTLADQARTLDEQYGTVKRTAEELRALYLASAAQAERLQELDDAKRKLLANVSHELRTPISLIIGPLGVLAERLEGPDLATVELALRNGERLHTLVGHLLDLTRSGSGTLRLRAQRICIGERISSLVQRFPVDGDRPLTLDLCHPDPQVWCDPEMLDTLVGNLVANAREHGDGPIQIRVRLEDQETHRPAAVCVSVADRGPGLPEGDADLFERFQQGAGAARRGGLGLGLALVRELVELHGGEVNAANGLGGGAVFSFSLPLGVEHLGLDDIATVAPSRPVEATAPEAAASAVASHARVLLVEDNSELRVFLRSHLAGRYQVWAVETAEKGQQLLEERRFDLLVSDIMLPGMSGMELSQWVRAGRTADLPILLISAKGDVGDRVEGLAVADDYLSKPFQMRELLARCAALLRRRSPQDPTADADADDSGHSVAQVEFLRRLEAAADARLSDSGLNLDGLSRAVGVSKRNLHDRLQAMGLPSPGVWLRERRLDRAEALVEARAFQTVGEVAAAVGLSRAYLSRAFKARTGVSPGARLGRGGS